MQIIHMSPQTIKNTNILEQQRGNVQMLALTQRVLDLAHGKLDILIIDSSASLSQSEIAVRDECLGKAYTLSYRLADVVSVMKPT